MKKILLAAFVLTSNVLYSQHLFPWLQGIEGCFTNNYFQASIDFSNGSSLPNGSEKATLYFSDLARTKAYGYGKDYTNIKDSTLTLTTTLPTYAIDKKSATIDFTLSDSLYNLLKLPDNNYDGYPKWYLTIIIENALKGDTATWGNFPQKDSIKLLANDFFLQVLNAEQHTFDRPFTYEWKKDNIALITSDTTSFLALSDGWYSLSLQGQHCSDTYSVYFEPIRREGQMLIAPQVKDASYQWYHGNVLMEGAISSTIDVSQTGMYKVEVTFPANYTLPNANTRMEAANVGVYSFAVRQLVTGIENTQLEPLDKTVVGVYTLLGEPIKPYEVKRGAYIYQYSDGSTRKVMVTD